MNTGTVTLGGPIVTAGGLVFSAATMDNDIRAFDAESGKEIWKYELPAGGQATPMTYTFNGKQYLVIAAGGHGKLGTKQGDYVCGVYAAVSCSADHQFREKRKNSECAAGGCAAGPGPLKIESA